jgi:hypothetical protein
MRARGSDHTAYARPKRAVMGLKWSAKSEPPLIGAIGVPALTQPFAAWVKIPRS